MKYGEVTLDKVGMVGLQWFVWIIVVFFCFLFMFFDRFYDFVVSVTLFIVV